MAYNQPEQIAWIDVETTGLTAENGRILELGIIITGLDLSEIKRASWIIHCSPEHMRYLDPKVRQMHTDSGLLHDLTKTHPDKNGISAVQHHALVLMRETCSSPPILAGYRVAFDRRWLKAWMPILETNLSEYTLDISCWRQVFSGMGIKTPARQTVNHRTLADCDAALNELRGYEVFRKLQRGEV